MALGGAVLVLQAFLPGAERKCKQGEENTSYHQDGPRGAHAGHGPGEFMVQRHLVVAGEQRKNRLVEDQHGEKDQDTWCACVGREGGKKKRWQTVSIILPVTA